MSWFCPHFALRILSKWTAQLSTLTGLTPKPSQTFQQPHHIHHKQNQKRKQVGVPVIDLPVLDLLLAYLLLTSLPHPIPTHQKTSRLHIELPRSPPSPPRVHGWASQWSVPVRLQKGIKQAQRLDQISRKKPARNYYWFLTFLSHPNPRAGKKLTITFIYIYIYIYILHTSS